MYAHLIILNFNSISCLFMSKIWNHSDIGCTLFPNTHLCGLCYKLSDRCIAELAGVHLNSVCQGMLVNKFITANKRLQNYPFYCSPFFPTVRNLAAALVYFTTSQYVMSLNDTTFTCGTGSGAWFQDLDPSTARCSIHCRHPEQTWAVFNPSSVSKWSFSLCAAA